MAGDKAVQLRSHDALRQASPPILLHLALYCLHHHPTHATNVGLKNICPTHKTAHMPVQNVRIDRKRGILPTCVDRLTRLRYQSLYMMPTLVPCPFSHLMLAWSHTHMHRSEYWVACQPPCLEILSHVS